MQTPVLLSEVIEIFDYLEVHCGRLSYDCDRNAFDVWLRDTHIEFQMRDFSCKYPNGTDVNRKGNPELLELVEQKCIVVLAGCVTGFVILILWDR